MVADVCPGDKSPVNIVLHYNGRFTCLCAGDNVHAVFLENGYRPGTHATGDDALHAFICEPAGQETRLMWRRVKGKTGGYFFCLIVHIEHLEFFAVPKMRAELII